MGCSEGTCNKGGTREARRVLQARRGASQLGFGPWRHPRHPSAAARPLPRPDRRWVLPARAPRGVALPHAASCARVPDGRRTSCYGSTCSSTRYSSDCRRSTRRRSGRREAPPPLRRRASPGGRRQVGWAGCGRGGDCWAGTGRSESQICCTSGAAERPRGRSTAPPSRPTAVAPQPPSRRARVSAAVLSAWRRVRSLLRHDRTCL